MPILPATSVSSRAVPGATDRRRRKPRPPGGKSILPKVGPATAVALLVGVILGGWATPAAAHVSGMGLSAWNYQTTVNGISPPVSGLAIGVREGGNWIILTNTTGRNIIVIGYLGEPYLRVGPAGIYENANSPSLYLAQAPSNPGPSPLKGQRLHVEWVRIGDGTSLGWHDHRIHWADPSVPPEVENAPQVAHTVIPNWRIPLIWNGRLLVVTGKVVWTPGPSPWPWFGGIAVAIAMITVVGWASRRSRWTVRLILCFGLIADLIWAVDRWSASYASASTKINGLIAAIGVVVFAGASLVLMRRAGRSRGMFAAALAGICLICDVVPQNGIWRFSDVPTSLTAETVRILTALAATCGVSLVLIGWHHARWLPERQPQSTSSNFCDARQ